MVKSHLRGDGYFASKFDCEEDVTGRKQQRRDAACAPFHATLQDDWSVVRGRIQLPLDAARRRRSDAKCPRASPAILFKCSRWAGALCKHDRI
jgi:hypothetical protein